MADVCANVDAEEQIDAEELCAGRLESLLPHHVFVDVVTLRRKLHRMPELAFQEVATAAAISTELDAIEGVEVLDFSCGGTGVLAIIEGGLAGGPTILFRADLVRHAQ